MKKFRKLLESRRKQKAYIDEIEEDFLFNRYRIMIIADLVRKYKNGEDSEEILKKIGKVVYITIKDKKNESERR